MAKSRIMLPFVAEGTEADIGLVESLRDIPPKGAAAIVVYSPPVNISMNIPKSAASSAHCPSRPT